MHECVVLKGSFFLLLLLLVVKHYSANYLSAYAKGRTRPSLLRSTEYVDNGLQQRPSSFQICKMRDDTPQEIPIFSEAKDITTMRGWVNTVKCMTPADFTLNTSNNDRDKNISTIVHHDLELK